MSIFLAFSPNIAHFLTDIPKYENRLAEITTIPKQNPRISFEAFLDIVQRQLHINEQYQQAAIVESVKIAPPVSGNAIESALVNIFCTATYSGENIIHTITGSGVFIDTHGIILTNAHVAQFLLLTGQDTKTRAQCVIRQNSPAIAKYEAHLLYISPTWIAENAKKLSVPQPSGTGEYDFALLYVTRALEGDLPGTFPWLVPDPETNLFNQMSIRAAGYPAEMLATESTYAPLVPSVATTSIRQLFTFGTGEIDLLGIAPSIVGQQGSSGGPIVNDDGAVVGLIVTRGNPIEDGARSLRALTIPYINRRLQKETGLDLARTLAGNITLRAQAFQETVAPHLRELLLNKP